MEGAADFTTNGAAFIAEMNLSDADTGAVGGANADDGPVKTAENVNSDVAPSGTTLNPLKGFNEIWGSIGAESLGNAKSLQVGANSNQTCT